MGKKNFENGAAPSMSAKTINDNMQWTKYHSPKGGHGFAAEDANMMAERMRGNHTDLVGTDNAKNGADLLINGIEVQVKFCRTPQCTLEACFNSDGIFRYKDMKILVPQDQHKEVIELLKQKIREGKVPGIVNPNDAEHMVKRGHITYKESQAIRQAGTKESLCFDALNQAQVAGMVGGLAAGMTFISALCKGKSAKDAWKAATKSFVKAGTITWLGGIATQQFLRTSAGRSVAAVATKAVKSSVDSVVKTNAGKTIIDKLAHGFSGKALQGIAARNAVTKAVRVNVITSAAMFFVESVPDTYKLCTGKMDVKEFGKSRAVGASGVAGGTAGYMAGMAIGTAICPGIGTAIGGLIGGIGGGMGASTLMNKFVSLF